MTGSPIFDVGGGGSSRKIRVGNPDDPRLPLVLSRDEAVLLLMGVGAYRNQAVAHAEEDDHATHKRDDMQYLDEQLEPAAVPM